MNRELIYIIVAALFMAAIALPAVSATELMPVPAQTFIMGDTTGQGRPDQLPTHPVTLTAYSIAPRETTVEDYCAFLNSAKDEITEAETFIVRKGVKVIPEYWTSGVLVNLPYSPVEKVNGSYQPKPGTAKHPMYYVTWEGAALYCNWLSKRDGLTPCYRPDDWWACDFQADGYHLPTEAQWECAARGGKQYIYPNGNALSAKDGNFDGKLGKIVDTGSFAPNPYGLYDMVGNVDEWCNDWYNFDYYSDCESGVVNPSGPLQGGFRVIRGGTYYQPGAFQTCAYRYGTFDVKGCFAFNGFRIAKETPKPASSSGESKASVNLVNALMGQSGRLPFSFRLGGKHSSELVRNWKASVEDSTSVGGSKSTTLVLTDPKTGLEVTCQATTFDGFPAVDWVLRITNKGKTDSPIIEDVRVLDQDITMDAKEKREFILRHSHGSRATMMDFAPTDELLPPGVTRTFTGHGGRPSDQTFPFMNLSYGGSGAVIAIGWTGQWQAQFDRDKGRNLGIKIGMQHMRLKLHPGESIRTPRVCVLFWNGDDMIRGHNQFRRLILAHYNPRIDGKLVHSPISAATAGLNVYTEQNQIATLPALKERGVEVLWMDAGWFVGGFPNGAGNWVPRPECFPNGLGPVGDAVHANGMKFLVWFEPERVSRGSRIEREFPQWTIGPITEYGGLFNWGIPEARKWMTDLLSDQFTKGHIDIYRQDINMEPLGYWQRNDTPDRQGMTEIRFVEGMYQMWDDLRARHPGLWIDNCASGGRLIDLETSTRSIPLWQSDAQCENCPDVTNQLQNAGLNLYLPMHSAGNWGFEPSYSFRSGMMSGNALVGGVLGVSPETMLKTVEMYKMARPFFEGDYYPLSEHKADETMWYGYQLDRPDLGKGMIMVFRRSQAAADGTTLALRGMDPNAQYKLWNKDTNESKTISGVEMRTLAVRLPSDEMPGSRVIFYEKVK